MSIQIKTNGSYADIVSIFVKTNGAYSAVQNAFVKVGGTYQSVSAVVPSVQFNIISNSQFAGAL